MLGPCVRERERQTWMFPSESIPYARPFSMSKCSPFILPIEIDYYQNVGTKLTVTPKCKDLNGVFTYILF